MDSNQSQINRFFSQPDRIQHEEFMRQVMEIVYEEAVFTGTSRDKKVTEWMEPEFLMTLLGKQLPRDPQPNENLIQLIKTVVRYSVKTGHPHFINQLFSR